MLHLAFTNKCPRETRDMLHAVSTEKCPSEVRDMLRVAFTDKCSGNTRDLPRSAHWTGLCLSFAFLVCALEHLTLVQLPFLTVVRENTCYHIHLQVVLVSAHICYW